MKLVTSRRVAALMLAAAVLPSAGCASGARNTDGGGADATTLDFFVAEGPGRQAGFAAVIKAYEEANPGTHVRLRTAPFSDFFTQIPVQLAGKNPPDVILADSPQVQSLAFEGAILPLDEQFPDLTEFTPSIVKEVTFKDHLYGAPWEESSIAVYYNKAMFDAAGVKPPQEIADAWTWPEFVKNVDIVRSAAAGGRKPFGSIFLGNPPLLDYWQLPMIRSAGEKGSPTYEAISPDKSTVRGYADTPEAMGAYEFWVSLYKDGFLPKADVPDAFGKGAAATMVAFPAWGSVLDSSFPDLKWGVTPLPYFKTPITHTGGWAPVVTSKSNNSAAAKKFVQFISSPQGFETYFAKSSVMPARKSLLNTLEPFRKAPLKLFVEELEQWGQPRPSGPGHDAYAQLFGEMMRDMATGTDVKQAVPQFVQKADEKLSWYAK